MKRMKSKNVMASVICIIAFLIVALPFWFLVPIVTQQVFEVFTLSQTADIPSLVTSLFPTASETFTTQVTVASNSFISKLASTILNNLAAFLLNFPTLLLHSVIVLFVFFFTIRDTEKLQGFVKSLSPLSVVKEQQLIKHFKDITNSIVYGQIIIGIAQGILAGLGLLLFGVPNALILTLLATVLAIIPIVGPTLVWVPVTIYLLIKGSAVVAVAFFIYNAVIVNGIDNILRPYIVSKNTDISPVVILVGMIGGLFIFGILGLIIGPLILAYFLVFLQAYQEGKLDQLFA